MNGADIMIKCLEKEKVEVVFGYPGVAICPFYNSILDSSIRSVLVRSEQNAAHAASGLSRVTGKVGVCAVTSGPGATNLLTGIATAFADSIPMVCICGQVDSSLLGSDVFQEADITGAAESFVKYSYLVKDAEDLPRIFKEAFHIANTGRKGPVLIDVPIDVQNQQVSRFKYPEEVKLRTYKPTVRGNLLQVQKVGREIARAKRPVVYAGGGVYLADAQKELIDFVERFRLPVVSTMMGIGALPSEHPQYFGMVGNNGVACANRAIHEADLLIMVGARVADRSVNQPEQIFRDKILVHIDVDPCEIGKNAGTAIPLVGDARAIFEDLVKEEADCDHSGWLETLRRYKKDMEKRYRGNPDYIDPREFIRELSRKMEEDGIYVADVGQNQIWSCGYHIVKRGRFLTSGGMGTMGYSLPAAMGAKIGCPNRQVVAVCGDGAFQMSMMELGAMVQHGVDVKLVVLQNGCLGMVREYQHNAYKDRYSMIDLTGSPRLDKLAEAYGLPYLRIEKNEEIGSKVEEFLSAPGLALMECMIDPLDLVSR